MRPVVVPFFIAHQGCPERCVFCDQEKIAGAGARLPDQAELVATIARYRDSAPGRDLEVAFFGGSFTALPKEDQEFLLGALQPLLGTGVVSSIRLSTRPDAVDAGCASYLKSMGVTTVELGVQSMDDEVLRLSGRGHGARDSELAFATLQGAGLAVGAQLMPGLPGDSEEKSSASLERVLALGARFLRIYPTLVIAGTELAERYRAEEYQPLTLEQAVAWCGRMLLLARRAGVPVIRLGLQPNEELEAPGVVLAGPYHPAFGQLVASELCYRLMSELVADLPAGSEVSFLAPKGRMSDLVGQRRGNLRRLADSYGVIIGCVSEDCGLDADCIGVQWRGGRRVGSWTASPAW